MPIFVEKKWHQCHQSRGTSQQRGGQMKTQIAVHWNQHNDHCPSSDIAAESGAHQRTGSKKLIRVNEILISRNENPLNREPKGYRGYQRGPVGNLRLAGPTHPEKRNW